MTVTELADLVRRMRDAQKRFFRDRGADDLKESKGLEGLVDQAVARVLDPEAQRDLFDREGDG